MKVSEIHQQEWFWPWARRIIGAIITAIVTTVGLWAAYDKLDEMVLAPNHQRDLAEAKDRSDRRANSAYVRASIDTIKAEVRSMNRRKSGRH